MGVKGLTSFIKTNKRSLAKELTFSVSKDDNGTVDKGRQRTALVLDAWGIIYPLYRQTDASSTFGGSFLEYKSNLINLINAWRSVSLEPIFVFDGVPSSQKHKTLVNRLDQTNKHLELFWRTNPLSRQSIAVNAVPPLLAELTVSVLGENSVEYFMEEGEADSAVVTIAKTRHGLWAGGDSDFMIHDSDAETRVTETEGLYVPILEMEWVAEKPQEETEEIKDDFDDGFATVSKSKHPRNIRKNNKLAAKTQTTLAGYEGEQIFIRSKLFVPPPKIVALRMSAYDPKTLAEFIGIKPVNLPLLAALVGNDSSPQIQSHYLHRGTKPEDRITRVGNILKNYNDQSKSLVEYAVENLITPDSPSGVIEEICSDVMKSSADYIGVEHSNVFNVEKFDKAVIDAYKSAYVSGRLSPKVLEFMQERVYWSRFIMESVDERSAHVEIGRHLRQFAYMVSLATCKEDLKFKKVETFETEEVNDGSEQKENDATEDVETKDNETKEDVKEDTKEQDQKENEQKENEPSEDKEGEGEGEEQDEEQQQPKVTTKTVEYDFNAVTEYTRQGVTTVPVPVEIPSIENVLPNCIEESKNHKHLANILPPFPLPETLKPNNAAQLLPLRERLALYLAAHSSSHLSLPLSHVIASAPNLTNERHALTNKGEVVKGVNDEGEIGEAYKLLRPYVPFAAAVRHVILSVRDTAKAWTENTLEAVINMAIIILNNKEVKKEESEEKEKQVESPPIEAVRATAQVLCSLENSQLVADSLLLNGILTPCHSFFDGPLLHRCLNGDEPQQDVKLIGIIKEAILDGCPERTVTVKKVKKQKKQKDAKSDEKKKEKKPSKAPASRYDILAAMGMD